MNELGVDVEKHPISARQLSATILAAAITMLGTIALVGTAKAQTVAGPLVYAAGSAQIVHDGPDAALASDVPLANGNSYVSSLQK